MKKKKEVKKVRGNVQRFLGYLLISLAVLQFLLSLTSIFQIGQVDTLWIVISLIILICFSALGAILINKSKR